VVPAADTPLSFLTFSIPIKMTDVVKEPLNVAGLLTNIYSRSDPRRKDTSEPVVVLFFLHGRGQSADTVDTVARAAFAWATERQASSEHKPRDFIVVTFVRGFPFQRFTCTRSVRLDGRRSESMTGSR